VIPFIEINVLDFKEKQSTDGKESRGVFMNGENFVFGSTNE
jgi:hypothetical protein